MGINSCQRCGSLNLIADRALAGRIICSDCGTPASSYYLGNSNSVLGFKKNKIFVFLGILTIILVLIF